MKLIVLVCSLPFGVSSIHVKKQVHRLEYSDISSSSQNICKMWQIQQEAILSATEPHGFYLL